MSFLGTRALHHQHAISYFNGRSHHSDRKNEHQHLPYVTYSSSRRTRRGNKDVRGDGYCHSRWGSPAYAVYPEEGFEECRESLTSQHCRFEEDEDRTVSQQQNSTYSATSLISRRPSTISVGSLDAPKTSFSWEQHLRSPGISLSYSPWQDKAPSSLDERRLAMADIALNRNPWMIDNRDACPKKILPPVLLRGTRTDTTLVPKSPTSKTMTRAGTLGTSACSGPVITAQEKNEGLDTGKMFEIQPQLQQSSQQKLKPMKLQFYRTKMCPWVIASGHCRKDSSCRYAHSLEELRPLPDLSKTKMCETLLKNGHCPNFDCCKYAHSYDELRATQSFSKTKLCPAWKSDGGCLAGASCRFAHGEEELRTASTDKAQQPALETTKRSQEDSDSPPVKSISMSQQATEATTLPPVLPSTGVPSISVSYWQAPPNVATTTATTATPCLDPAADVLQTPLTHAWGASPCLATTTAPSAEIVSGGQHRFSVQPLSPMSLNMATNALVYLTSQGLQWGSATGSEGRCVPSSGTAADLVDEEHVPEERGAQQQHHQQRTEPRPSTPEARGEATTRFLTHLLPSGIFTPLTRRAVDRIEQQFASIKTTPDATKSVESHSHDASWKKSLSADAAPSVTYHPSAFDAATATPHPGLTSPVYYAAAVPLYAQPVGPTGLVSNFVFPSPPTAAAAACSLTGGPPSPIAGSNHLVLSPTAGRLATTLQPSAAPAATTALSSVSIVPTTCGAWPASAAPVAGQYLSLPFVQSGSSAASGAKSSGCGMKSHENLASSAGFVRPNHLGLKAPVADFATGLSASPLGRDLSAILPTVKDNALPVFSGPRVTGTTTLSSQKSTLLAECAPKHVSHYQLSLNDKYKDPTRLDGLRKTFTTVAGGGATVITTNSSPRSEESPSLFSSKSSSERTSLGLSPPPLLSASESSSVILQATGMVSDLTQLKQAIV